MDIPSRLDLLAIGRAHFLQRAKAIDPAMVDTAGSMANLYVGTTSVLAAVVVRHLVHRTKALTLAGADGEDLDRWIYDRYTEFRKGASPALGEIRVWRANTDAGAGSIPVGTPLVTLTGAEYVTTSVCSFSVTDVESRCEVRATSAGKASQVGRNQIRRFRDAGALFDRSLQVTNDDPTAGGEDREEDDDCKNRMQSFWIAARRGILPAIEQGARTVPGVETARAVETLTGTGAPARLVELYIADSSGVASKQLARKVTTALEDWRGAGIAVLVRTSIPLLVAIQLDLRFRANVDTVALATAVRAAVIAFVNSLPVNTTLSPSDLDAVLARFREDGLVTHRGQVVAPVGDLLPEPGQTIRTLPELVTVL